jgi:acetyl esterase
MLGIDSGRVSVGGSSAGGNLSAVVALMVRDRGGPALVFQVLDIPATDMTRIYPSRQENGEGYLLTAAGMEQSQRYYIPDPADEANPYASPMCASDLLGLPPALVMTAEFDPLRDEGEAYGRRLIEAGVPTTMRRWAGQIHGSQDMGKVLVSEAKEYRDLIASSLRCAYSR